MQLCDKITGNGKVLYVSGEESAEQVKIRADYYDKKAKEQSKEVERLRQEREKIREETYGNVWK